MKHKLSQIKKYLSKSPEAQKWRISPCPGGSWSSALVIPALAESGSLLKTLASLAANGPDMLGSTLVLCVINNREPGISSGEEITDNKITIDYLKHLSQDTDASTPPSCPHPELLEKIKSIGMTIAYVDASTPGNELPSKGGVGLARKIGMDLALATLDFDTAEDNLIICLDADTLVEDNYISEIRRHFKSNDDDACVLDFSHILPEDKSDRLAAVSYELFLRYFEMGLRYARSPYAYHTIGSTIVCRAGAYAAAGGMNRKQAGEDFYFLQNLAKYGKVGRLNRTRVYPSMRISDRVPFGTGRKMGELAECTDKSIPFYNPRIFRILREFISLLNDPEMTGLEGADALEACLRIDEALAEYLERKDFETAWNRIRQNSKNDCYFRKNLHVWFDAFQTLKLAHHLRDSGYGTVDMTSAIAGLFSLAGMEYDAFNEESPEELLEFIRDAANK